MPPIKAPTVPLPAVGTDVWIEGLAPVGIASVLLASEGGLLCLDPPQLAGRPVAVSRHQPFRVSYRSGEVPCHARVRATEPTSLKPPADGLWAELTDPPRRDQKRDSFRVPVTLSATLAELDEDGEPREDVRRDAQLLDLSSGGARVALDAPPGVGVQVELAIDVPDGAEEILVARGSVVREIRSVDIGSPPSVGIAFHELPDEKRVRRFLIERQRLVRRRELGLV